MLFNPTAPKQSRPCVCLAWHEQDTNLLAIGHDRNRSDHCITVWDTERGIPKEKAITNLIGLSETAHSLCWDKQSRILIGGMSHKYIKVFDFRRECFLCGTLKYRFTLIVTIHPHRFHTARQRCKYASRSRTRHVAERPTGHQLH